jgi:acyl-homoserine lactone acylase PvdQ
MPARLPRSAALAAAATCLAVSAATAGTAAASSGTAGRGKTAPGYVADAGGFRSVLAYGQGQTVNAAQLARYEATGKPPRSFLDEAGLYNDGVNPDRLTDRTLGSVYKNDDFEPANAPGSTSESVPHAGVTVATDKTYGVPRIYGRTRADVMWGAGYVAAQERLFLMDVLRRTAEGDLAALIGPSGIPSDNAALRANDLSPAQLTAEVEALPRRFGRQGAQALADLKDYVAGINGYISQAKADPQLMPAEYPALGTTPARWTLADSAAEAYLLIGQFTVSGAGEPQQAMIYRALEKRLGKRTAARVYAELRNVEDPLTPTTTSRRFPSDDPRPNGHSAAMLDPGSFHLRDAVVREQTGTGIVPAAPAWTRGLSAGLRLPHVESNAVVVAADHSATGHPIAVMGPQVGYYSPEILIEEQLHAPGIQIAGMTFPGAAPYPLIGHGLDFAWTGTTAMGDNADTFAEVLCDPAGGRATERSTHYWYRGRCRAFGTRTYTETTPVAPSSPGKPETYTLRELWSVHGPVEAYATVHGRPVALTLANATYHHGVQCVISFLRLAEDRVDSPRSFIAAFRYFTGNENWFYLGSRSTAWYQSGWFPMRAPGTDIEFPFWGTGRYDWQGFDPRSYTYRRLPDSANPTATNPRWGYLVNWNNKAAPGWHAPPGTWTFGSVQRVSLLENPLRKAIAHGRRITLAEVARINLSAGTEDLRGTNDLPELLRVLGRAPKGLRPAVAALRAWQRAGAHRRAAHGGSSYARSAAVLLMDAWWPRLVSGMFEPVLGRRILNMIAEDELAPLHSEAVAYGFDSGWEGQVQADLRLVLGQRLPAGAPQRAFCGGGNRSRCRAVLLEALRAADAALVRRYGPDMAKWREPVLCPADPTGCDENNPITAGAVATPAQPFQNRGTYQQAVSILRSIPRSRMG